MAKKPPPFNSGHPSPARRGWAKTSRGTRTQRGYGWAWDQLRAKILKGEPLCRTCRADGRSVVATTVDHIVPKSLGGTDEESNLQSLCIPCHKDKTAREGQAARVRTKFFR